MNLRQSVLGVDPGNPGAAVMLDARGHLVFVAVWKGNQRKRRPGYQISVYCPGLGVQQSQLPRRASARAYRAGLQYRHRLYPRTQMAIRSSGDQSLYKARDRQSRLAALHPSAGARPG